MTSIPARFRGRYGPWGLVAGASEGLGAAFARGVAARGLDVVLVARREKPLAELAAALEAEHGVRTRILVEDLGSPGAVERILEATCELEIGLFVYNAALSKIGPLLDQPLEDLRAMLAVNCAGPLGLCWGLGRPMRERGRGGMVLMSSLAGFQGGALLAAYAATKAFNLVLAEGLWDELRGGGVDVLASCAGATLTPNFEASRPARMSFFAPAPMPPGRVVDDAFAALGKRPSTVPGLGNRFASFLLHRFATRKAAVSTLGDATRAMYEER